MSSIKIRLKKYKGVTLLRTLISHPMETGLRMDPESGNKLPAHYIEQLTIELNGTPVAECALGPGISSDPYFSFRFYNGNSGDRVQVRWQDNLGRNDSREAIIP